MRLANDYDTDTLIQDGPNMCWTSGPAGMSDGGTTPRKSSGHVIRCWALVAQGSLRKHCEQTICRDLCKGHQLRKSRKARQLRFCNNTLKLMSSLFALVGNQTAICAGLRQPAHCVMRMPPVTRRTTRSTSYHLHLARRWMSVSTKSSGSSSWCCW